MVLLIKQITECKGYNELLRKSYAIFFWFNIVALSWICLGGFRQNADKFLIAAGVLAILAHPIFFWLPIAAFYKAFKSLRKFKYSSLYLIFLPFIWVSFEYLHSITQFSFPWLLLGNTQTYNLSKIQFIEITGVYGLTFWICALSSLIFYLYSQVKNSRWKISSAKSIAVIASIILLYFAPDIYTLSKGSKSSYQNAFTNGELNVGVVQQNANPWERWAGRQTQYVNELPELISELRKKNPETQLIVLPETAITYRILSSTYHDKLKMFSNIADSTNTPLLIGLPYEKIYADSLSAPIDAKRSLSGLFYDTFNTAALIEKGKTADSFQLYKKNKLVMGGERIPYQQQLAFLKDFVSWGVGISQWQIGKDTINFKLDNGAQFNTAICYESAYPEYFSKFVLKGADFCTIITNDAWWWKFFGTYQHNQFAVLRAVENRRWIVRSANTGISCLIDPYGNKYNETGVYEQASFAGKIGLMKEKTFYTLHGDWLCVICLWASGGILLLCIVMGFNKNKKAAG